MEAILRLKAAKLFREKLKLLLFPTKKRNLNPSNGRRQMVPMATKYIVLPVKMGHSKKLKPSKLLILSESPIHLPIAD